jgi:hypothetical protein
VSDIGAADVADCAIDEEIGTSKKFGERLCYKTSTDGWITIG